MNHCIIHDCLSAGPCRLCDEVIHHDPGTAPRGCQSCAKLRAENERLTGEVKRLCDTLTTIADRNFEDEETAAAYAKTSVMISLMGRTSGEEG